MRLNNITLLNLPLVASLVFTSCLFNDKPSEPKRETFNWALTLQLGDVRLDSITADSTIEEYTLGDTLFGKVHYIANGLVHDSIYFFNKIDGKVVRIPLVGTNEFAIPYRDLFLQREGLAIININMLSRLSQEERGSILTKEPFVIILTIKKVIL